MHRFDYIVAGAGCAGLSFLVRLLRTEQFNDKRILLIDKEPKTSNDRTWCFWEQGEGLFEPIVYSRWEKLWFYGANYQALHMIAPYHYKMIRGIDFYQYCLSLIHKYPNVTIEYASVRHIDNEEGGGLCCIPISKHITQIMFLAASSSKNQP